MRVKRTVSSNLTFSSAKPQAIILTRKGEKTTPRQEKITSIIDRKVKTVLANSQAFFLDSLTRYPVKMGMKATVREPSANSLLNKLGILKATKKASAASAVPKK